ncbi:MAG: hypothetical protein AB7O97_07830 [Planctomycetota bacterium]
MRVAFACLIPALLLGACSSSPETAEPVPVPVPPAVVDGPTQPAPVAPRGGRSGRGRSEPAATPGESTPSATAAELLAELDAIEARPPTRERFTEIGLWQLRAGKSHGYLTRDERNQLEERLKAVRRSIGREVQRQHVAEVASRGFFAVSRAMTFVQNGRVDANGRCAAPADQAVWDDMVAQRSADLDQALPMLGAALGECKAPEDVDGFVDGVLCMAGDDARPAAQQFRVVAAERRKQLVRERILMRFAAREAAHVDDDGRFDAAAYVREHGRDGVVTPDEDEVAFALLRSNPFARWIGPRTIAVTFENVLLPGLPATLRLEYPAGSVRGLRVGAVEDDGAVLCTFAARSHGQLFVGAEPAGESSALFDAILQAPSPPQQQRLKLGEQGWFLPEMAERIRDSDQRARGQRAVLEAMLGIRR